ncbi:MULTISPECIES: hypothetical protein [Pseudomonas syringae group]|uniref:Uncharacterized protein n=2 Tax=Pseudomonas syringae group TaxID=136849 RepID=A0ABY1UE32_PSESX|nr:MULTISPECIES: hypothetical protein [Pseudomonas syringae group]KWT10644.1 hypothetical protein AL046_17955 [Pseudomonas syringae pv. avii]PHN53773.1 hypothetical protein AO286_03300 [Pseudomonas syringae]POQ02395.1 hypothetical protein CXB40_23305 [Pseudomonas syringae pv. avii]SOQ14641.1 Hypothetical protein NCPPB2254_05107 [Pseudomonas syringae pv. persicae]SOQ14658.1 Hypothetical protein CFBP1573P_05103 [Pseudomonas syringae pv. persicae]
MPNLEAVTADSQRPDNWSSSNAPCCARYQIVAEAEPALLCQVLNLLAMQYLIPHQLTVVQQESTLIIDLHVARLSWHRAQVIGEKMRNLIDVCSVGVEQIDTLNTPQTHVALATG